MRTLLRLLTSYRRRRVRMLAELHTRVAPARPKPTSQGRRFPNGGAYYRTIEREPISPGRVRDRRFANRVRNGLDPGEVGAFQHRVADELAALRAELASTQDENLRIKRALRDWQSQFQTGMAA